MKTCTKCGVAQVESSFGLDRRYHSVTLRSRCKRCCLLQTSERRRTHPPLPAERRRRHLRRCGLTPEQYEAMTRAQGHGCAICGGPPVRYIELDVDHDHRCCKRGCDACRRALLCGNCNRALGGFADDPHLLLVASAYLESWR